MIFSSNHRQSKQNKTKTTHQTDRPAMKELHLQPKDLQGLRHSLVSVLHEGCPNPGGHWAANS